MSQISRNKALPAPGSVSSDKCDVCGETGQRVWTCIQCNNDLFCEGCWKKERAHRLGAVGFDGKPHEKTDREVVERLREILEPTRTAEQQQELHRSDEDTTWFGIAKDSSGLPVFQDYERYATVMEQSRSAEGTVRHPQLVSFIGQTGAGKSTLIKMLIDHKEDSANVPPSERFPSPVSGNVNDNIPTSGDVHLYSDPASYRSSMPMLYADCEGLDGGENIPRGARYRQRDDLAAPALQPITPLEPGRPGEKPGKIAHNSQRDLSWATTPETRKREYAVTQLYPRLLYTFSDVVVFVLRNSKIFESIVLEKLLDWASASIEKSLNQPALPHMIIALNASDLSLDERQWGVEEATRILMADIEGAISRVPRFQEYANLWRDAGREIRTTKDLLECYYSSVTVVRIPSQGRYMLMNEQISKLHFEIKKCCQVSYWTKKRVRILSSEEKLQVYLQRAFDHFSQNLNSPFDFVKEAVKNNPIPRDFGGNILKLAIAVRDHNSFPEKYEGQKIWSAMSQMVASCLMLNSARQSLLGSIVQLLDDVYADLCDEALENFCNLYWPCEFSNEHGKCCNMRSGHNPKGHQNKAGKILAVGNYQSTLDFDSYADVWINNISSYLEKIQKEVYAASIHNDSLTEVDAAAKVHCKKMNDFYRNVSDNVFQFVSHSTCFSCLRELPEHPLPCGHILCTPCVKAYGRQVEKSMFQLGFCPLHVVETEFVAEFPWKVKIKPLHAGVRILSLDGGGVNGIAQLEMLRAIESQLGGDLPIQAFFDLIVGTGTAGMLALGLGVGNWSVEKSITEFTRLCEQAYTPREFLGVPLLGKLSAAHHRSMYKTRPFEKALQKAFEERPLFGGLNSQDGHMVKVAVTATTLVGRRPVVLANYNRPDGPGHSNYLFERQDKPNTELRTWEAARATSARPPYFKSFTKDATKTGYTDGSLHHRNPVGVAHQERLLIWKDVSQQPPDLFLSLGTGFYDHSVYEIAAPVPGGRTASSISHRSRIDEQLSHRSLPKSSNQIGKTWSNQSAQSDGTSNCTRQWIHFHQETLEAPHYRHRQRYVRLDPDLGFPIPRPDAVSEMDRIQQAVAAHSKIQNHARIKEIAHRLVASTFFFEKADSAATEKEDGTWECDGSICCRFSKGSEEMRALGRYIQALTRPNFEPYFLVQEDRNHTNMQMLPLSEDVVSKMCTRSRFKMSVVHLSVSKQMNTTSIYLCLQSTPYLLRGPENTVGVNLPISGFPRTLMIEALTQKEEQPQDTQNTLPRNSTLTSSRGRHRRRLNGVSMSRKQGAGTGLGYTQKPPRSSGKDSVATASTSEWVATNLYPPLVRSAKRFSKLAHVDTVAANKGLWVGGKVDVEGRGNGKEREDRRADSRLSLRQAETSPFPDSPEDVARWMERRRDKMRQNAMGDMHPGLRVDDFLEADEEEERGGFRAKGGERGSEIPRIATPVFEMDDTSLKLSPSSPSSVVVESVADGSGARASGIRASVGTVGTVGTMREEVATSVEVGRDVGPGVLVGLEEEGEREFVLRSSEVRKKNPRRGLK